ncbi:hypothetical protein [Parabacteroides merdae]|uniref:hypothetical protein n=1 Tax=Parabacteroides merdae TaxID=46503 RepID=UPI0034A43C2C
MITVVFFTWKERVHGTGFIQEPIKHEIATGKATGKSTIEEAYAVAIDNGANPYDTILFKVDK